jgi:diaminopropionate ammonia-lyase
MSFLLNSPPPDRGAAATYFDSDLLSDVRRFYGARPALAATPLHRLSGLAASLGIGDLLLKDESSRFGLSAFKVVGVAYAVDRLAREGAIGPSSTLVCATAGNHGRAVARAARDRGLAAKVFVPAATATARIDAIAGEGAEVVAVPGPYEAAVERAAEEGGLSGHVVVSDTSWPGYDRIPLLIMAGYTHLLEEAQAQWQPEAAPDVVIVQAGVGGLATAVTGWAARRPAAERPFVIVAEPEHAACVLLSLRTGGPATVGGGLETVMAGLRCADISPAVWPVLRDGVDACVAVSDEAAEEAMRRLAHPSGTDPAVTAGASGACGVAALMAIASSPDLLRVRVAARLDQQSRVLAINTEGATEPEHYGRVTGKNTTEPGALGA